MLEEDKSYHGGNVVNFSKEIWNMGTKDKGQEPVIFRFEVHWRQCGNKATGDQNIYSD